MSTRESREHDARAEATWEAAHHRRMRETTHPFTSGCWFDACDECSDAPDAPQHITEETNR